MGRFGKQSLNRKLTLVVVAAAMTAVLVIAIGALWQEARRHTQGKLDYLAATASVFASATSAAVARNDQHDALEALRGVAHAPDLLYARVATLDGRRLAEIGSGILLQSDVRLDDGDRTSYQAALFSRTLQVSLPIIQGGRVVGRITLVADNSDLLPSLGGTLLQTLLGALAALAVAAAVASRLQRWVARPLLKLTDTVRHISQSHDYSTRVEIETQDEVGDLCEGFNVMLGEIKDRERKIIDLALHDAETDLPNRLAFEREIGAGLETPRRGVLAVAAIGVDRFQYVRGVIGYHLAGDLLGEIGSRVACFSARGMAARMSTDVVGFLIEAKDADDARVQATATLAEAEAPMLLGANSIDVNLTIGLALAGVHADSPQALIEHAHIALDQARATHAKIATFDENAYRKTASNLSLMTDMARALTNGEMSIALQPKYHIRDGAVTSAEVLARWRDPQRGMVAPDLFVGMAEETGAIGALTHWVLQRALECQARLVDAGLPATLAVNISGRLLGDAEFVDEAVELITKAPAQLYLEITETATIDNQERALLHIATLVAAGAHISIDDYGAGLSSLTYLKRIPAHELKIDKAFVQLLGEHQRDALLVRSTIDLAHSLGMQVTAEGVETDVALSALATMGCDFAQGYFIAKPMPEAEYTRFLREFSRDQMLAHA
ncbi:MAG: EAL domain-containing protein [Pseudomonadota bacterium]